MAYTDKTYFLTKIKEDELNKLIADNDGTPTDSYLVDAVKSADSLINSYLKNVVVTTPLPTPPDIIKQYSYDLAIFYLHDRIQYTQIPQWVIDKYSAAIDSLTKIAKGIITLEIETEDTSSEDYVEPDENILSSGNTNVMGRGAF